MKNIILLIIMAIVIAILMTVPLMLLWNYLMPIIFGLVKINFWQALCMSLLSMILFKSTNNK